MSGEERLQTVALFHLLTIRHKEMCLFQALPHKPLRINRHGPKLLRKKAVKGDLKVFLTYLLGVRSQVLVCVYI